MAKAFLTGQQALDHAQSLVLPVALGDGVDAQHISVRRQSAAARAEHRATAGHVVQLHHALRHDERVVVGQGRHAGAQANVAGALGDRGDEQLRAGDQFIACGVVLADPGFLEAQPVHVLDQFQIPLEGQGRVFTERVERGDERPETKLGAGHGDVVLPGHSW